MPPPSRNLSPAGDLREAAANLFAHLHELDRQRRASHRRRADPGDGLGEAINDRLSRAAAPRDSAGRRPIVRHADHDRARPRSDRPLSRPSSASATPCAQPSDIAPYLTEPRGLWHGSTPLVLRPGSVDEVAAIMRLATETGTPVVPQGGNTGLVGGQVPRQHRPRDRAVAVAAEPHPRDRPASNTVTAEAGVILQTLQEAADAADRLFPLSLASQGSCQIGGNLSSNAGGTGVLAYGNARELCLGVEVVLPTGEVLDDLRKLKKDNTGYDLKNLFVGAEGTLGVITAAVLKLFPKPKGREVAWVGLTSPEAALALFGLAADARGRRADRLRTDRARGRWSSLLRHVPDTALPLGLDWPLARADGDFLRPLGGGRARR